MVEGKGAGGIGGRHCLSPRSYQHGQAHDGDEEAADDAHDGDDVGGEEEAAGGEGGETEGEDADGVGEGDDAGEGEGVARGAFGGDEVGGDEGFAVTGLDGVEGAHEDEDGDQGGEEGGRFGFFEDAFGTGDGAALVPSGSGVRYRPVAARDGGIGGEDQANGAAGPGLVGHLDAGGGLDVE